MSPIFYSPCEECKHKKQRYGETSDTYCDVCALMVRKKNHERLAKEIMNFLNRKSDDGK